MKSQQEINPFLTLCSVVFRDGGAWMHSVSSESAKAAGFTLIEMSIVLVIIGLILGGVLVGRDLIRAAAVRAQISQIERYQTAVNTFRGKYNALPGDLNATTAAQFGFAARGTSPGQGDGNFVIEGSKGGASGNNGFVQEAGETAMFWEDLSYAGGMNLNLIPESFNTATSVPSSCNQILPAALSAYIPAAKLGAGNYVYVWSGGPSDDTMGNTTGNNATNYFEISGVSDFINTTCGGVEGSLNLTVRQAYDIDSKIDDGLPRSGRVQTLLLMSDWGAAGMALWAGTSSPGWNWPVNSGIAPTTGTCSDNGNNNANPPQQYTLSVNNGAGVNCALSIQFQ
jgi:prepilin-type N-terminal cleavage/methylation domain-containing protein